MVDLSAFNPNEVCNPENGIFGLPFHNVDDAKLVILPVPWEATLSYNAGTARSVEHILKKSFEIDLFDLDFKDTWKQGFYMQEADKKILTKSDYLRKEAELFVDYICHGDNVQKNSFMCKSIREINQGSEYLNQWVFEQTNDLLNKNKLVGVVGGDHSVALGFIKALAEKHNGFGILQIDAHCDLRKAYEGFKYSHLSVMYNVINEIPQVNKLVQIGVRDFSEEEWNYLQENKNKIVTFFDRHIKERILCGATWNAVSDEIIEQLPDKIYISFDIDGLDPKLCPSTAMPVPGGFEASHIFHLIKKLVAKGKKIIGFDLAEVGSDAGTIDANVGARMLWQLCNWTTISNN